VSCGDFSRCQSLPTNLPFIQNFRFPAVFARDLGEEGGGLERLFLFLRFAVFGGVVGGIISIEADGVDAGASAVQLANEGGQTPEIGLSRCRHAVGDEDDSVDVAVGKGLLHRFFEVGIVVKAQGGQPLSCGA